MKPLALFCYVIGLGAPLTLVIADPEMSLPAVAYGGVLALALGAWWLCLKLDPLPRAEVEDV